MTEVANGSPDLGFRGRIFVRGEVRAITGLHIGGSAGPLAIGNVDQPVVRNLYNGQPYLPGSSLRGKMRSLTEKFEGKAAQQRIGNSWIHTCKRQSDYLVCNVCQVFGVPGSMTGEADYGGPTRLLVRDVALSDQSAQRLGELATDLPYTEIKWEVAIDRITAAATPRQLERVPAGAVFSPLELVYTVYADVDLDSFALVLRGLLLVEDDYLGGQGSRGSGKVQFENLQLSVRSRTAYDTAAVWAPPSPATRPAELLEHATPLQHWLRAQLSGG